MDGRGQAPVISRVDICNCQPPGGRRFAWAARLARQSKSSAGQSYSKCELAIDEACLWCFRNSEVDTALRSTAGAGTVRVKTGVPLDRRGTACSYPVASMLRVRPRRDDLRGRRGGGINDWQWLLCSKAEGEGRGVSIVKESKAADAEVLNRGAGLWLLLGLGLEDSESFLMTGWTPDWFRWAAASKAFHSERRLI
ncbi:hypothetical protein CFIMG_005858RAa [Ceratocystis fimbriata CBS 114723]|uniref:Uncharacterized protein n=1 Tax=Ceratocystis fimbriata CBS 114723 TaxID=1035309 RepID=A0A2C5WYS8_9PEZI|nr:hypothetical protein CFIMG_005858RAa [Ceratocystis fimbriata CBS 114723]